MDKSSEQSVKACHPRQLVGPRSKPEPVRSTVLPEGPWTDLAIDLHEIPGGNHLLVVIDYYSRWSEVAFMKKTNAKQVIKCVEAMFQTHGLPFASSEFEQYRTWNTLAWTTKRDSLLASKQCEVEKL